MDEDELLSEADRALKARARQRASSPVPLSLPVCHRLSPVCLAPRPSGSQSRSWSLGRLSCGRLSCGRLSCGRFSFGRFSFGRSVGPAASKACVSPNEDCLLPSECLVLWPS
eukprot:6209065-Pleurochrysis_carterae.AAC.4